MAQGNINLTINGSSFGKQKIYNNVFENSQEVDNTDGFINVLSVSTTKGANTVSSVKALCIYNEGTVGAEIQLITQDWKDNSNTDEANSVDLGPGSATVNRYITMLLPAGEFLYFPNGRLISYAEDASGANATSTANATPHSDLAVDSTADVDTATDGAIASGTTTTTLYLEDGHSKFFRVGDLIRLDNEICEVTAVGTGADLANSTLTIIRGSHGSTAATHADDVAVGFPYFNAYNNYNKYSVAQTNKDGKFKAMNFYGLGRTGDKIANGIVPGSVCFKFYQQGYQELGLSGITANTNSGLAASQEYKINISVDGGSVFENLAFTTDSSNTNMGGKNGVFLLLAAPTSGTTPFGVGRIPAIGSIESAVAARLPEDTIFDRVTDEERPNIGQIMYDDGNGNLVGAGSGTISYSSGEHDFTAMPNAEYVISATYLSAHSGGTNVSTTNGYNHITTVGARSTNQKLNAKIKVVVMN
jgi:hypothetical protein